ncbi:hypothetical protein L5515_008569 [Caenorhabditis briggsae]|uniref:SGNH domain-containing protein n=1 Tax=Caenorhabditis briggsae TaxID=6238 RepID=A0AAE9F6N8_CAEBR|nr:hypothetical protein L5515_008569 [Caenorhabditis briggsae]
MVHFYLGEYLWKNNNRYSLASLFLVTNQLVIHDQADYFNAFFTMTSSINAFLHLWSLSVEMQFYLLVPFIFLGLQMLEHNYLKLIAVSLITIIGCIAYLLVLEQFAFNFMLLRLWQFSAGFVALFCANPEKLPNKAELSKDVIFKFPFTKDDICTVSLATLGSCLIPQKLNVMILRPVVALSTAIIISSENKNFQKIIDTNKAELPFFWKHDPKRFECTEEKIGDQIEDQKVFGYGSCGRGNGNFSIMMIGNSFVMNLRTPIRTHFNNNFTYFRYISLADGYGLYADTPSSHLSLEISRKNVERYKPDVLFILGRHFSTMKKPLQEDDQLVQEMNNNIKFYEKFVKKIYILDSLILFPLGFMDLFLQNVVHRPEILEGLHLNRMKADMEMKIVKKRFSMLKCTKCKFFDLNHAFLEGDKYLTFDRDTLITYCDNTFHLTSAGLKLCDNALRTVAQEVMDTI